jgi:hypothetical protein
VVGWWLQNVVLMVTMVGWWLQNGVLMVTMVGWWLQNGVLMVTMVGWWLQNGVLSVMSVRSGKWLVRALCLSVSLSVRPSVRFLLFVVPS